MDAQRLVQAVIMDLSADKLKLEDHLESTMNSDMVIYDKIKSIKSILAQTVSIEAMIDKFTSLITNNNNNNNNNNDLNKKNDGKN